MTCTLQSFPLEKFGRHSLPVPLDATFLSVQFQGAAIVLWFAVSHDGMAATGRTFFAISGGEVSDGCEFLGTVVLPGSDLAFHVFEDLT